jgi:hypothetical protein
LLWGEAGNGLPNKVNGISAQRRNLLPRANSAADGSFYGKSVQIRSYAECFCECRQFFCEMFSEKTYEKSDSNARVNGNLQLCIPRFISGGAEFCTLYPPEVFKERLDAIGEIFSAIPQYRSVDFPAAPDASTLVKESVHCRVDEF